MSSPAGDSEQQSAIMSFWRQRQFTNLTRLTGGCKFSRISEGVENENQRRKGKGGKKVRNRRTGWGGPASRRWWVLVARATLNRQNNENMALFSELSSNVTFFPHHELFSGICGVETDSSLANLKDTRTIYWHLYKLLQQSLVSSLKVRQQPIYTHLDCKDTLRGLLTWGSINNETIVTSPKRSGRPTSRKAKECGTRGDLGGCLLVS